MVSFSNTLIAGFNLVPIVPLDGGRILKGVLEIFQVSHSASILTLNISKILPLFILFAGLILVLNKREYILLVLGMYLSFITWRGKKYEPSHRVMTQLLYKQKKIRDSRAYPVKNIVCMEDRTVLDLVKEFDMNKYHMVYILDHNLRVKGVLCESDILECVYSTAREHSVNTLLKEAKRLDKNLSK